MVFFLLNFNPDLFTHPFWHVGKKKKKNACREGTEQSSGQAVESTTSFSGSSGFAYKGCLSQPLRKLGFMHFGLMGLFLVCLTIKYTNINLIHNDYKVLYKWHQNILLWPEKVILRCNSLLTTIYKSGVWQGSKIQSIWKNFGSHREALQQSRCWISKTSFNLQQSYGKKYNIASAVVLNLYLVVGSILELKEDYLGALELFVAFHFYHLVK